MYSNRSEADNFVTPLSGKRKNSDHSMSSTPRSISQRSKSAGHTPTLPQKKKSASGRLRQMLGAPAGPRSSTFSDEDDDLSGSSSIDHPTPDSIPDSIQTTLGEISSMLGTVIKRLERNELKLESMERKLASSTSGSCSESTIKKTVPKVVRVCTIQYVIINYADIMFMYC